MISRRQFLGGLALLPLVAGCGSSASSPTAVVGPSGFPQPRELRSENGLLTVTLVAAESAHTIGGRRIVTPSYNGGVPGPTLRLKPGDVLALRLENNLPANTDTVTEENRPHHFFTTNLHTHGLHISPKRPADDIFLEIEPGQSFDYRFEIPEDHPGGTYWYHPHVHGSSGYQTFGGMCGAIIIEGATDLVPEIAAAAERTLVIAGVRVDESGRVPFDDDEYRFLKTTTELFNVNGVKIPVLTMRQGEVQRWRVLNAGGDVTFPISVDEHDLNLVAVDGNTLGQLETVEQFMLSPGNRVEVLVRAGAPGTYQVRKLSYKSRSRVSPAETLALLVVTPSLEPRMALPSTLPSPFVDIADAELTGRRELTFSFADNSDQFPDGEGQIEGESYAPGQQGHLVEIDSVEEWTIYNADPYSDHPFHIHINPFQVMSINDVPLDPPRWQDTVNLPRSGKVVIRHRFQDFEGLSVMHCHVLLDQCIGMMRVLNVIPKGLSQAQRRQKQAAVDRLTAEKLAAAPPAADEFCGRRQGVMYWGPPRVRHT